MTGNLFKILGIKIRFVKDSVAGKEPVMVISRHDGAHMFSVFRD